MANLNKVKNGLLRGFSLTEILVVVAIIGILSSISIYAITTNRKNRSVKVEAEKIRDFIDEARSSSMNPPENITNLKQVEVDFQLGTDPSVTLEYVFTNNGRQQVKSAEFEVVNLSTQGKNKIIFPATGPSIGQLDKPNSDQVVTVTSKADTSQKYELQINDWGTVEIIKK